MLIVSNPPVPQVSASTPESKPERKHAGIRTRVQACQNQDQSASLPESKPHRRHQHPQTSQIAPVHDAHSQSRPSCVLLPSHFSPPNPSPHHQSNPPISKPASHLANRSSISSSI